MNKNRKRNRYQVTISEKNKFIWFQVAKVASRSLQSYFREYGDCLIRDSNNARLSFSNAEQYYKFAFTRNPYDRLVSCWLSKVTKGNKMRINIFQYCIIKHSFQAFVRFYVARKDLRICNIHFRRQTALIPVKQMDFIGQLENMEEDFRHLTEQIGLPQTTLQKRNVSTDRKEWDAYYTPSLMRLVSRLYAKDFELFGYDTQID